MKITKIVSLVVLLAMSVVLLGGSATPASAATETKTLTITEAEINAAYRVTNPRRRSITNVSVDLQEGQVAINATITFPEKGPYNTVTVITPVLRGGALYWKLASATVNGKPVPPEVLAVINSSIFFKWQQTVQAILVRRIVRSFKVNTVTITADAITIEYTRYSR